MHGTRTKLSSLVVAAQGGDRRSLDELVSVHLPLVYTIVRRALSGHPDADDVVQEVVLRAVRDLRELRSPESFRAWLAAIAIRQVSTYLDQRGRAVARTSPLDAAIDEPDAGADVERLTLLRLDLSDQRAEVVRASRWLDADDRALLSLWWLEVGERLTRAELAEALGVSVAHAAVRVQRMRTQLDLSRSVVAALEARPRCARLDTVIGRWDGLPGPTWRKRVGRHVRSCPQCRRAATDRVAVDRLLVGAALLPVPAALAAMVTAKVPFAAAIANVSVAVGPGAGVKAGLLAQLAKGVVAHPVAAACAVAALVAGVAVADADWSWSTIVTAPPPAGGRSALDPPPSPVPSTLSPGPMSLEAVNQAGYYMSTTGTAGVLVSVGSASDSQARQGATFDVVAGLNDPACFSFRLADGRYLRHSSWRLRVFANDGTALFRGDATFCVRPGSASRSIALESSNYPGWFLRHRGNELWVDHQDGTSAFSADSAFRIRRPLAG